MRVSRNSDLLRKRVRTEVITSAAVAGLAASGMAHGAVISNSISSVPTSSIGYIGPVPINNNSVASGNSFDIAVVGYDVQGNGSSAYPFVVNDAGYLVGPFSPTFGTTATETAATVDGETVTITSSETATKGVTTDKITVSVTTRFVPVDETFADGDIINEEDLEIGFAAGTTGLTFSEPVTTTITASGTALYGAVTGKKTTYTFSAAHGSAPYTYLNPTDTMLSADEGLESEYADTTPADLTHYNISSFSFSFVYNTPTAPVPEPTTGMVGLVIGSVGLLRRRSRDGSSPIVPLSSGLVDEPMLSGVSDVTAPVGSEMSRMDQASVGEAQLL
jgi:hypothetical protein